MKFMKLLIIGHGRHGKDTAAEMLHKSHGLSFQSSSEACNNEFIFDKLKDKYNYSTPEDSYKDRHNHREEWFKLVTEYNREDPTRLARLILSTSDIYVGLRSRREYEACVKAKLFDHILWIDASKRLPPESANSNELTAKDADTVIYNNTVGPRHLFDRLLVWWLVDT